MQSKVDRTGTSMSTRRQHLRTLSASLAYYSMVTKASAANPNVAYGQATLPSSIRSRFLENINGLKVHILEAGFETPNRPCVLLLHGFPELAYSWRKVKVRLAEAGYHAVVPDQRGFGRTRVGTRAVKPTSLPSARST